MERWLFYQPDQSIDALRDAVERQEPAIDLVILSSVEELIERMVGAAPVHEPEPETAQ